MCALHHSEWSDDVMMTSQLHLVITARFDDVTQHNHGNHGKLLSGRFMVSPMSQQEVGNYYLSLTNSGVMNIMTGSEQQLEVRHEYLMTVRTHAPTTATQTPTSTEYQFKILYLTLNSIMAVGNLLLDYVDYDTRSEQYSMTYI